jgi:hypothetical protein
VLRRCHGGRRDVSRVPIVAALCFASKRPLSAFRRPAAGSPKASLRCVDAFVIGAVGSPLRMGRFRAGGVRINVETRDAAEHLPAGYWLSRRVGRIQAIVRDETHGDASDPDWPQLLRCERSWCTARTVSRDPQALRSASRVDGGPPTAGRPRMCRSSKRGFHDTIPWCARWWMWRAAPRGGAPPPRALVADDVSWTRWAGASVCSAHPDRGMLRG